MSSEVDDTVELHLIDTRQLVEEARKIREAEKLAKDARKVQEEIAETTRPLAAGVAPLPSPEGEAVPKGFFAGGPQGRKQAITGGRTQNAFNDLLKKIREMEGEQKQAAKKQFDLIRKLTGMSGNPQDILSASNLFPIGVSGFEARIFSTLGRFGVIGSIIAGMGSIILQQVREQFDRGGAFSTKLKVTQQALTINDLETENEFRSGTKYITDDLRIVQKAPQNSNTANIKYEHIRYTLDDLGR